MSTGWIKLHRSLQDNKLWTCEKFTRGQAWVDLLMLANHSYTFFYLRDHKIEVQRGQIAWSQLQLSFRWKWSRTKVKNFLKDMEKEQQLVVKQSHTTTILTIVNYDIYQEKEQQDVQQESNRKATGKQQESTYKNVKKVKNDKNVKKEDKKTILKKAEDLFPPEPKLPDPPKPEPKTFKQWSEQELKAEVIKVNKNRLSETGIDSFVGYWSETSDKGKMRLHDQKYFDVTRRIGTWNKGSKSSFGKSDKPLCEAAIRGAKRYGKVDAVC